MIDNFALAVSHGLLLVAFWRLAKRPDLDSDPPLGDPPVPDPKRRVPARSGRAEG